MSSDCPSLTEALFSYPTVRHFTVSWTEGTIKITFSPAARYRTYTLLVSTVIIALGSFLYIYFNFPPIEKRFLALLVNVIICTMLVGIALFDLVKVLIDVYTFDRVKDRIMLRNRLLCRATKIKQVEIRKDMRRSGPQELFNVALVRHDGRTVPLLYRVPLLDELIEIANIVSEYLSVLSVNPEVRQIGEHDTNR